MKKSKILPFLYAGVLAFTITGVAIAVGPETSAIVTVAHADDSSYDLSNFKDGQWWLY